MKKALKFIAENVDMRTVEYTTDMAYTTRMPCVLISPRLADDVYDLLVEYGQEHDLKEDWWQEYGEIEDWIKNLK